DLIRGLAADLGIAVIIVTHDLAVARLLSHRIMVMRQGRVVESGLTDQVDDVNFAVRSGECVALSGPSGAGKSSILKMIYGNYRADRGAILVRAGDELVDIVQAGPRRIIELR